MRNIICHISAATGQTSSFPNWRAEEPIYSIDFPFSLHIYAIGILKLPNFPKQVALIRNVLSQRH